MGSLTLIISIFTSLALSSWQGAGELRQSNWQSHLAHAERLSCDISFTKERAVWPSDSAKWHALTALELVDPLLPNADSARVVILTCLGDYYLRDNYVAQADSFWSEASRAASRIFPRNHAILRGLAWRRMILESERGNTAAADSLRNLALTDTSAATTISNRASYLHELAQIYTKLLRLEDNWRTHEQVAQEWRIYRYGDPRVVIIALMDLAEGASKLLFTNFQNEFAAQDSAIRLGEEALQIARDHLGHTDASAGYVLNRLGDYYARRGDRITAEKYWEDAYAINKSALPIEHIECQGSLDRLGNVAASKGEFTRAEEMLSLGVELRKQTQGEGHQEVASLTSGLAGLYRQMGHFARAESLYTIALDIRRKALPRNHPDIASSLNSLGRICMDQGKTADAETYWRNALAIRQTELGANNAATVSIMQNLAELYHLWGRTDDAESMLVKSVEVKRGFLGEDHPQVAAGLLDLAKLHLDSQKIQMAQSELSRALAILNLRGDDSNVDALLMAAEISRMEGNLDQADSLVSMIVGKLERSTGVNNFHLIPALISQAEVYRDRSDFARADSVYRRAIAIAEGNEITASAQMVDLLSSYGHMKQGSGQIQAARQLYADAYRISLTGFQDAVRVLPELKAARFAAKIRGLRDSYISSLFVGRKSKTVKLTNSDAIEDRDSVLSKGAALILCGKAIVSEAVLNRRAKLMRSNDSMVSVLLDSLRDVSLQLSRTQIQSEADNSFARFDSRLRKMSVRKLHLEESLVHLGYELGRELNKLTLDEDQTFRMIREYSPLIEYVKYHSNSHNQTRYAAFVAHRNSLWGIDLGSAQSIEISVDKIKQHMSRVSSADEAINSDTYRQYLEFADRLTAAVWRPLQALLPDTGKVYVIPDGALNLLAFGALPDSNSKFLIERYEFSYLNSIHDLERNAASARKQLGILALGDPDFAADPSQRLLKSESKDTSFAVGSSRVFATRGVPTSCRIQRDSLAPLISSRDEVENAGRLWRSTNTDPATVLVGVAASEENFKRLAVNARTIHIATHAYFLSRDCFPKSYDDVTTSNPLLLSGLFLAGAAAPIPADSTIAAEDGILTSEEIATMDLRGTKCVILSACESGLGSVSDGEGVYGLRRAFQLAGVQTIVSTLWNVPDQSTARLMHRLYASLEEGITPAVRRAQLSAIEESRAAGLPPHPYSWGAFIVVGE